MQQIMQQRLTNSFCIDGEGVIEKNIAAGVSELNLLTRDPLSVAEKYKQHGLAGKIVVYADQINKRMLKKLTKQGFDLAIYIDLLLFNERELEKLSLTGLPVFIPLYDDLTRTGQIDSQFGMSPAKLIEEMGFLDRDCTIVGGAYADKDDLELLGSYDAKVAVCPISQSMAGSTFSNIVLMQKHGLKIGLGSGANPEIDLKKESEYLYLTTLSLLENPQAITLEEIQKLTGENT